MEPTTVPGLTQAERAFRTDAGEIVVVKITRRPTPDERHVAMEVQARIVDGQGATAEVDGVPLVAPGSVRTIMTDALAAGTTTIQSEMAKATVNALDKALRHAAAMRAWAVVPATDQ